MSNLIGGSLINHMKKRLNPFLILIPILIIVPIISLIILSKYNPASSLSQLKFERQLIGPWEYTGEIKGVKMAASLGKTKETATIKVERENSSIEFDLPITGTKLEEIKDERGSQQAVSYKTPENFIEVKYKMIENGVKEEIILNKVPNTNVFRSRIKLNNLTAQRTPEGTLVFYDDKGNYQFHFQDPFVKDTNNNVSYGVKYSLTSDRGEPISLAIKPTPPPKEEDSQNKGIRQLLGSSSPATSSNPTITNNDYVLAVEVDREWLTDPKRIFPIIIDPTVVHDTQTEFAAGSLDRIKDVGIGETAPQLESNYQELPADINTASLWHMENNWNDSSGNGYNGTAIDGTTFTTSSKVGSYAGHFDGTPRSNVAISSALNLTNTNVTIETWVNLDSTSENGAFVKVGGANGYGIGVGDLYLSGSPGNNLVFIYENVRWISTSAPIGTGWHHVAMVIDNSGTPEGYIDGNSIGRFPGTDATSPTGSTYIGGYTISTYDRYADVTLDEVRISDTARTPEEIKADAQRRPYAVYTSEVIDFTSGNNTTVWDSFSWTELGVTTGIGETLYSSTNLYAQWNLNEASGTTAANYAGSCGASCNGTLTNFANTAGRDIGSTNPSGWTADNRRWGAGALRFDGTDDYVNLGTGLNSITTFPITVEAWIKIDSQTGTPMIVQQNGSATNYYGFRFGIVGTYQLDISYGNGGLIGAGNRQSKATKANVIAPGQWYHVVGIIRGATDMSIYVNGVDVGGTYSGSASTMAVSGNGSIGRAVFASTFYLDGTIDSLRIYTRALSASEIIANYNAGNIELQARVGSDSSPDDGSWEEWRPVTSETQIDSFDSNNFSSTVAKWSLQNIGINQRWTKADNTTPSNSDTTGTNGRIPLGLTAGRGDVNTTTASTVIKDGNTYKMWYSGNDGSNVPRIYYATSSDGLTWTKQGNSIPSVTDGASGNSVGSLGVGSGGKGDVNGTLQPTVIKDGSTYKMWYVGKDSSNIKRIYYATSSDGLTWTKQGNSIPSVTDGASGNSVGSLGVGSSGKGDFLEIPTLSVIKDGSTYKMWYMGNDVSGVGRVYYATSADGLTWAKYDNTIPSASNTTSTNGRVPLGSSGRGDDAAIWRPAVIKDGPIYKMWYSAGDGSNYRVYYATSFDGLVWSKYNNITPTDSDSDYSYGIISKGTATMGDDNYVLNIAVIKDGASYKTWYSGNDGSITRIYHAVMDNMPMEENTASTIKAEGSASERFHALTTRTDPKNTKAIWHLDETGGTGAYIKDSSSNANHGTPTGTTIVEGVDGKARYFNGTSDYINVGSSINLANDHFALSAWAKRASSGTGDFIIGQGDNTTNNTLQFGFKDTNVFTCAFWGNALDTPATYTDTDWHYWACTYNSYDNERRIYRDGVLVAANTAAADYGGSGEMSIGRRPYDNSNHFHGAIDEVMITKNSYISPNVIAEAYRAGRGHHISSSISSINLADKTKVPFYIAADRPGGYLQAIIGESAFANYEPDGNTVGLWHLEENTSKNVVAVWVANGGDNAGAGTGGFDAELVINGSVFIPRSTATCANNALWKYYYCAHPCTPPNDAQGNAWYSPNYDDSGWPEGYVGFGTTANNCTNILTTAPDDAYFRKSLYTKDPISTGALYVGYDDGGRLYINGNIVQDSITSTGAVAYWNATQGASEHLVDTEGFRDDSIYVNNGFAMGTDFVSGTVGKARSFNGSTDYINVSDSNSLDLTTFTVDLWVYLERCNYATYQGIVGKGSGDIANRNYSLFVTANACNIHYSFGNGSAWASHSSSSLALNRWYHLAYTFGSSTSKFYINGILDSSSAETITPSTNGEALTIGTVADYTNFDGLIDEVRVSNTVRSADEIRQAYEIGQRTHPIIIDFKASLGVGTTVAEGATSFTIDTTEYGATNMGDNLYKGDKIIIKENYNGTEYIAQGTVTAITASTGATTVASWDAGSTFPSGGYTANAAVFKWQREYFDITGSLSTHRDAVTRLTLRMADGSQGVNFWLDDIRYGGSYLTTPGGSTITSSTGYRYFQYRTIFSSWDANVSPSLTALTIDTNEPPESPTTPWCEGVVNPTGVMDITPEFSAVHSDDEGDEANAYEIEVNTAPDFQGTSMWDSDKVNLAVGSTIPSGSRSGTYAYNGTALTYNGQTYYWRIRFWDDRGAYGDWSATQNFTMAALYAPSGCRMEKNDTNSQITIGWNDTNTIETGYQIDKSTDGSWSATPYTTTAADATSYLDSTDISSNHNYQYRIRATANNEYSDWCYTTVMNIGIGSMQFEGVGMEGLKIQ
jgi:hypothetical protein